MGIYVLFSEPSAAPLLWHTDFCPEDGGGREGGKEKGGREEYLHNLVNVLVPMQALDEAIGFTVVLDKEEGRRRVQVRRQGHWYALVSDLNEERREGREGGREGCTSLMLFSSSLSSVPFCRYILSLPPSFPPSLPPSNARQDPGYPHAADGNNRPIAPGNERLMLNITYVHPSFPHVLRRHVISHLEYYKQHLPRSVWKQ
jgi:hypothetical protein